MDLDNTIESFHNGMEPIKFAIENLENEIKKEEDNLRTFLISN